MLIQKGFLLAVVIALSSCGGGNSGSGQVSSNSISSKSVTSSSIFSSLSSSVSSSIQARTPAKIEVTSELLLLTQPNQTQALKARVLDESGNEIIATVTWESSNPTEISVDSRGVVAAHGIDASAQITASIGSLKSIPLMVAYTQIANGALLVTDAQILGDPLETDPSAPSNLDNTYSVKLTGVTPEVGQVIVNSGNKPVVGRVKSISTQGGVHEVTLGMVPVKDALPNLRIKESFDMRHVPALTPADLQAEYDVVRDGSSITYTPKATVESTSETVASRTLKSADESWTTTGSSHSLNCEFTVEGVGGKASSPIKLTKLPSLKVDFNPDLELDYDPVNGLKALMLHANPKVTIEGKFIFDASVDPKLTCTIELDTLVAPVSGPFAALLGPSITFYGGIEVSAKTSLKGLTFDAHATISSKVDVGIRDCSFVGCVSIAEASTPKVAMKTEMSDLAESYRFEPSVFVYGMAKLGVANPLLKNLRIDAFYTKLGPALNASLARPDGQISDPDPKYKSNYSLDAQFKAGLDTSFKQAAFFFGINGLAENLIDQKWPLSQSPTGNATTDVYNFKAGDTVNLEVKLDPENLRFLGFYNVKRVVVFHKTGSSPAIKVASSEPRVDDTSLFKFSFTAHSDGKTSDLYAFVETNDTILASVLNGLPLEIGKLRVKTPDRGKLLTTTYHVYQTLGASCALSLTGDFQCWGGFANAALMNNLLDGPTTLRGFGIGLKAIDYNSFCSTKPEGTTCEMRLCAITPDGGVKCSVVNNDGSISSPIVISGLINIQKLAGSCGVNTDQQLWCIDHSGNAYQVNGLPPVIDIFNSGYYFALTENGLLTPLTETSEGVLVQDSRNLLFPQIDDVLSFAPGINDRSLPCVVKTNSEVQCLEAPDSFTQPIWKTVTNTPANTLLFANASYQGYSTNGPVQHTPSCAVTREGTISCKGTFDVVTSNTFTDENGCKGLRREVVELDSLVRAANMINIVDISLSENLLCTVNNKNEVSCVGENWTGQLGYKSSYPTVDAGCTPPI